MRVIQVAPTGHLYAFPGGVIVTDSRQWNRYAGDEVFEILYTCPQNKFAYLKLWGIEIYVSIPASQLTYVSCNLTLHIGGGKEIPIARLNVTNNFPEWGDIKSESTNIYLKPGDSLFFHATGVGQGGLIIYRAGYQIIEYGM